LNPLDLTEFHAIHHRWTHVRAAWFRAALPPAPLPEWFYAYFLTRGINAMMIAESGAIPLTCNPSAEECNLYRASLKSKRINEKSGGPDPLIEGILFRYFVDEAEFGAFGVARAFSWTEKFQKFYTDKGEDVPKMLSPRSEHVKASSHLYILPAELDKVRKSSVSLHIIEGQAKTLKLIQDFRTAGIAAEHAVIGITGVEQFLPAAETHQISWRNRMIYFWFDADSQKKPAVAQAEIKAAAYCHGQNAKAVQSVWWPEERGNGYDDHSVYAEAHGMPPAVNVKRLLSKAKDTFRKYAPDEDREGLPLVSVCRAIAKVDRLTKEAKMLLQGKIDKLYKPQGYKSKEITQIFEEQISEEEHERQKHRIQAEAQTAQRLFGIDYALEMPENFFIRGEHLAYFDTPLCRLFILKKYIASEHADDQDKYLARFIDKEILIPSDAFTNYRNIAQLFNRNREILHDSSARLIQRYISMYWIQNKANIPIVPYFKNTGWDKAGQFRLPTLQTEDANGKPLDDAEYDPIIKRAFHVKGDEIKQRAFVREVLTKHQAGLMMLMSFATPLIGLLNLKPTVVMIFGNPGDGKSTAGFAALSLYGDYTQLYQTLNATKVGKEVACALMKDIPILFDELNTAGNGDGVYLARALIETIYGFYAGKGKTRSTVNISLANQSEYQGLLMLTSEKGLDSIFSVIQDMSLAGAYRRTLEVPILQKHTLWNYDDSQSQIFFKGVFDNITNHYGYVGRDWLTYLSDHAVQHTLKKAYEAILMRNGEAGLDLKGTDSVIALLEAITPHVEILMDIQPGTIWTHLKGFVTEITKHQQQQIRYQMQTASDKFRDCLNNFISSQPTCFDGVCPDDITMQKVYGLVKDDGRNRHVFLRPEGLQTFCNLYGFDRSGLLTRLKDASILIPWPTNQLNADGSEAKDRDGHQIIEYVDYKSMKIRRTGGNAYHFVIPDSRDWNINEELVARDVSTPEKIF